MKKLFFLPLFAICLAFLCGTISQAKTLDDLQKHFEAIPVIRCEFRQEKKIKGLVRPLKSSGELLIARDTGIFWNQKKPFQNSLLMNGTLLVQHVEGQTPQIISAEKQPQLFQFNRLLVGLFRADREVLEKNFTVSFTENNDVWTMTLAPRESPLDKIFRRIKLEGRENFETAIFEDAQGDCTKIQFSNFKMTPSVLTESEKKVFAQIAQAKPQ